MLRPLAIVRGEAGSTPYSQVGPWAGWGRRERCGCDESGAQARRSRVLGTTFLGSWTRDLERDRPPAPAVLFEAMT